LRPIWEKSNVTPQIFKISPVWDDDAEVYISKTDIIGLNIQADTLDEFNALVEEFAAEFIQANHCVPSTIPSTQIVFVDVPGVKAA